MKKNYLALFGENISQSYSPYFHQEFIKQFPDELVEPLVYEKISVTPYNFNFLWLKFLAKSGMGANVTAPCKRLAFSLCTRTSKAAKKAGSINTIRVESETEWYGDNTDGIGFIRDIVDYHGHSLKGKRILVLGAGGAAAGIIPAIAEQEPEQIIVANRSLKNAELIAEKNAGISIYDLSTIPADSFDFIINTATELPLSELAISFSPECVAYDIRYTPSAQPFKQWAKQKGAGHIYDGYGMLLEQAAASFAVWFGVQPRTDILRQKPGHHNP